MIKRICRNTGRTRFKKGFIPWWDMTGRIPWNKGLKGIGGRPKGIKLSEEHKQHLRKKHRLDNVSRGEKHYNWKGGITDLRHLIRNLPESRNWVFQVLKKDNFICKKCGIEGNLKAHHIKPFSKILFEFLNFYSQFSPIEDKETLVRLALTYPPFFEVNNGETLCKECHKKEHSNRYYFNNWSRLCSNKAND